MSSSSETPEDGESPQKKQRVDLYSLLRGSSFAKYDNPKLLASEVTSEEMDGKDFLANMTKLDENHVGEMKQLAELANSDPVLKPNLVPPKKTFSTNTTILSKSTHFYVQRRFKVDLSEAVEVRGGFLLLHGPRSSGTSFSFSFLCIPFSSLFPISCRKIHLDASAHH